MTEYIIQPRLNTAAGAAANNRVLAMGERGYETDTERWKTGDGATNYNDLPYDDDPAKIAGSTATGRAVLTGDAAAGRDALGAAAILRPSGDTTGVTDSAAVQAFWDAGQSVRLIQDETYWVKGLVLKSNCHIWLDGATLKLPNGANDDVIVSDGFATFTGSVANGDVTDGISRAGIHAPGVIDGNKANQTTASTTIAAGSNGATLPQSTINVASTTGFPSSGTISLLTGTGMQVVTYTGVTSTTFTGCTGGGGSMSTGTPVFFKGFGLRLFWRDCVIGGRGNLEVRNCVADGIWTEWAAGGTTNIKADGAMENDHSGIKCYYNGRNGITNRGPHDSWWNRVLCWANGVAGVVTSGNGAAYFTQLHTWGTPQSIGLDVYTETHVNQGALEVTNVAGSMGLRINGVQVSFKGRVFTPPGTHPTAPLGGNIGIVMRGSAKQCDIDATVLDCNNGAFVTITDGGNNRIRLHASQTGGPLVVRFLGSVTSGSNGVNVSTFAGSGTLNVDDTTNWPSSGAAMVGTQSGPKLITYTGKTSTTLTGVTSADTGVLSTGHYVTPCNLIGTATPTNDIATVHASTTLDISVGGGTACPGVSTRHLIRKTSGSIAPDAATTVYGTPFTITATDAAIGLNPSAIVFFSSANVVSETLSFRIIATYADGTTATVALSASTYGITTNGATVMLDQMQLYSLMKNGTTIRSLAISVRTTINSSIATVTAAYAGTF